MTALTKLLSSKGEINIPDQTVTVNPISFYNYTNGFFGHSVGISDNYAIVGAYNSSSAGLAFIHDVKTGAYIRRLYPDLAYSGGRWGYSVAISNNYAIVGGPNHNYTGTSSGYAAIFDPATGVRLHNLSDPNAYSTTSGDNFGISVGISDNYAIVGAYLEDDVGGFSSGKAYIFNPATGALLHTLDNPNAYGSSDSDYFGWAVDISDNYAIVGAYQEDDVGGGFSSGKAYIFDTATGALLHTLDNPNAYNVSGGDSFGYSVGISDNYAIVGAYLEDDVGGGSSGKAYIFNPATGALLHTLDNPNAYSISTSDLFGYSVAISDNYAIVGAYLEDDVGGLSSGKAYIFNPATGALLYTVDNPNAYSTSSSDYFGSSVDISDNYAIVGASQEDSSGYSGSGKAYIFIDL